VAKTPDNHRKPWTLAAEARLDTLIAENTPTRVIALKLGRTPAAIRSRASATGRTLKPTNQSPYNRHEER
jgi:hypothetical protein